MFWLSILFQLLTLTGPALVPPGAPARLSLGFDPQGQSVSALQWTLDTPPGMSASFTPGAAAAGKTLTCNGSTCVVYGMDQAPIAAGEVATVDVAPTVPGLSDLPLSGLVAATPSGQSAPLLSGLLYGLWARPWAVSNLRAQVGEGSPVAITYYGAASAPADNGSDAGEVVTVTPPASMAAGDLVLVLVQVRYTGLSIGYFSVAVTGGQDWMAVAQKDGTNVSAAWYACRFNGTWAASPQFNGSIAGSVTAQMSVFRRSGSTVQFDIDVMGVTGTFAAGTTPFTKTITGITTRTNGAVVVAAWLSPDDNTWDSLTEGWAVCGSAQYRNTAGSDQSLAVAYQVFASAGATGNVALNQVANAGDAGISMIIAFKEVTIPGTSVPTVDLYMDVESGSNGNALSTTILAAATHGTGGTWSLTNGPTTPMTVATAGELAMGRSVTVGATTYADESGTRGVLYDHNEGDDDGHFVYDFGAGNYKNVVSTGFFYKTDKPYVDYSSLSGMNLIGEGAAEYAVFNVNADIDGSHLIRIETTTAQLDIGPRIVTGVWYWITMRFNKTTGLAELAVYQPEASWAQLGFTINRAVSTSYQVYGLAFGFPGGGMSVINASSWLEDFIADWTTAAFPLLPGVPAAGGLPIPVAMHHYLHGMGR